MPAGQVPHDASGLPQPSSGVPHTALSDAHVLVGVHAGGATTSWLLVIGVGLWLSSAVTV